jgi:hypothetical protein
MKLASRLALSIALLALVACGGSGTADNSGPDNKPQDGLAATALKGSTKSASGPADFLNLSEVRISSIDFCANNDLSAEAIVVPPVPEDIEFEYRWFVSNQEVAAATGPTLKSGNFRKQQWIICQARALAGEKVSGWLKSDWVRIANSPPQLEAVAVDAFTVPGQFRYQITASDIDNDELTYELLAPLDAGIELDKKSGLLTWKLDDKIVEKLGATAVISFSVSDNDAQPSTGSLTLRFQKKAATQTPESQI